MDDLVSKGCPCHDCRRCQPRFLEFGAYLLGIILAFTLDALLDNWVSIYLYHL